MGRNGAALKKRILAYLKYLSETDISSLDDDDLKAFRDDLLIQIYYFQHERFIHLVVTVTFAILTFITLAIGLSGITTAYALLGLLVILLVPYIKHYYLLENGVQKMYTYYDTLVKVENERRKSGKKS